MSLAAVAAPLLDLVAGMVGCQRVGRHRPVVERTRRHLADRAVETLANGQVGLSKGTYDDLRASSSFILSTR